MLTKDEKDKAAWEAWKASGSSQDRDKLFKRFKPVIESQVKKWVGPVPAPVLRNKAKVLAGKAFKSYDPDKGVRLSTHVTNSLQPISRVVYTHQNVVRLPENLAQKVGAYNNAVDRLTLVLGHEPSVAELHSELGWPVNELNRIKNYIRRDLVESVGGLNDSFYDGTDDSEMDALQAVYTDLTPDEKRLFELSTGFNGARRMSNPEIMRELGLSQAQLSYRKSLIVDKVKRLSA